ncbi:MAG TPA: DegT/DnrJ/EryC1/StrS family aminotransferase [Candidatus Synoicihabitans sp.]|nr:DegT/DnrJ/EryC1/StrS family aminotransferase [Candidatus Synoicihabitans sp.]
MTPTNPPLFSADPKAGYRAHAGAIEAAIARVLASGSYILGPEVEAFEHEFAQYQGGGYTVGVANGTEAIELALRAVGVGPGDLVATVANTVTATVTAIREIGARPLFVEVDPLTLTMAPARLEAALAGNMVKAVLPVHLYGFPAAMEEIGVLARARGAKVVEDCAQAHGATISNRKVGTFGDAAAFSFYPTKNLGALGDGGGVFTTNSALAERIRTLRQYGWTTRYVSTGPGRNSRLDEIQAAILRAKLPALDSENERRRTFAAIYRSALSDVAVVLPPDVPGAVYHQFVVRSTERERLRVALAERNIHAAVLYPVPVHRQPAFSEPATVLPETERACAEVLCLPVHPGLRPPDVHRVADAVREILRP